LRLFAWSTYKAFKASTDMASFVSKEKSIAFAFENSSYLALIYMIRLSAFLFSMNRKKEKKRISIQSQRAYIDSQGHFASEKQCK
jgi:hypothetical protein